MATDVNKKTVDVLIPAYRPGRELEKLLDMLEKQTYAPTHIKIVNTEESLWDYGIEERHPGICVRHIRKEDFDHGGTRRTMAESSNSDILLFMTQDAVPANEFLVEELVRALSQENVCAAYARQVPNGECKEAEKYTRLFNYPPKSRVKTKADLPVLGVKTYFCSNVCAAYDKRIYEELGGFVQRTIFNEDMLFASKAIGAGYGIAYAAAAKVYHSHDYTCRQQFHRNFDLGVSQAEYAQVFEGLPSEGEGIRLVKMTAAHLVSAHRWWELPELFFQSAFKYAGYFLGRRFHKLPKGLVKRCTMSPGYWK
ncbi:MAG: glycosyltransferase family 2 protein [Blautia sp.]